MSKYLYNPRHLSFSTAFLSVSLTVASLEVDHGEGGSGGGVECGKKFLSDGDGFFLKDAIAGERVAREEAAHETDVHLENRNVRSSVVDVQLLGDPVTT